MSDNDLEQIQHDIKLLRTYVLIAMFCGIFTAAITFVMFGASLIGFMIQ